MTGVRICLAYNGVTMKQNIMDMIIANDKTINIIIKK